MLGLKSILDTTAFGHFMSIREVDSTFHEHKGSRLDCISVGVSGLGYMSPVCSRFQPQELVMVLKDSYSALLSM